METGLLKIDSRSLHRFPILAGSDGSSKIGFHVDGSLISFQSLHFMLLPFLIGD
jgi:hypothetical protein